MIRGHRTHGSKLAENNTWSEFAIDEKRGIAYFPLGSPTYDLYGADRIGADLFGNCLLALDVRTGNGFGTSRPSITISGITTMLPARSCLRFATMERWWTLSPSREKQAFCMFLTG